MVTHEKAQQCLQIIGEAISIEPEEFQDHETWKFLGLGELLASATAADIKSQAGVDVPDNVFSLYPTVGSFRAFLGDSSVLNGDSSRPSTAIHSPQTCQPLNSAPDYEPSDPWEGIPKPKVSLSLVLQGRPDTAKTVVFLFPDGSGAGGSYGALPPISKDVCLIGLNSPFLRQAQNFTCSIERMARLWVGELQRLQPKGKPYVLGGWSAGGFYSYEVIRLLTAAGERVERLILIDSPCRLEYEALPAQVVQELTRKGLMGASGEKKAPEWLVQHFTSTVVSVDKYWPKALSEERVPSFVNFIWVKEGLVKSVPESGLEVDMNVKVTRFLLEPRGNLETAHWEKLLPGARYTFDYMTGNHFQITQSPHVESLARILNKLLAS